MIISTFIAVCIEIDLHLNDFPMLSGTSANIARTAVVNVCEVVSYDLLKSFILDRRLMEDQMPCHFTAAFGAGFITTVIASPVDVVKTRYMNSPSSYKNVVDCAVQMMHREGASAFYKG